MGRTQIIGTTLDHGIVVFYFVFVLLFGAAFARYTKSTKDFFFGGQRFPWWLIAFSMVAVVGSYSFMSSAAAAYSHGLSSTHSFLNGWFWMPFFVFGWLPIIYYNQVSSVPEYFERRFDRRTRLMAAVLMLVYLLGLVGINFYALGIALRAMLGWDLMLAVIVAAVICTVYVTAGGQISVIMTDLLQGALLLLAGFVILGLGISYLGGGGVFWDNLPFRHRLPLAYTTSPHDLGTLGIIWQDGLSQGCFFLFLNQGVMMRFLSAKSVKESRKAATFVLIVIQILAALALAGAGWLGRAMAARGDIPAGTDPDSVFMVVCSILCRPGVLGLVLAALIAALMSTADTLINATAAVAVNDLYRVYVKPNAPDRHLLKAARWISVSAAAVGVLLVPILAAFKSVASGHAAFTAMMGPPLAVAVLLGIFWRRYTASAAFWTILSGIAVMALSMVFPDILRPLAFGIEKGGGAGLAGHLLSYFHVRVLFGFVVCGLLGVILTLKTKPRAEGLSGLVMGTIDEARRRYKGKETNLMAGEPVLCAMIPIPEDQAATRDGRPEIWLSKEARSSLQAETGDLVHVSDPRWYLGGLRSAQAVVGTRTCEKGKIALPPTMAALLKKGHKGLVRVEKIL